MSTIEQDMAAALERGSRNCNFPTGHIFIPIAGDPTRETCKWCNASRPVA